MDNGYIVILITVPAKKEAQKIAESLISKKLAACINIVPGIESIFRWQGKIDKAKEFLLVAKTRQPLFDKLAKEVKKLHSYDCPEIIALPIIKGNEDYLKWIDGGVICSRC